MTIDFSYKQLITQLEKLYDVREASNIAELVLEFVTKKSKIWRIINKNIELTALEVGLLTSITEKLLENVPLQYVLNEAWFAGMKFYVNKSVLIPRPETEELIDWIIQEQNKSAQTYKPFKVLDIGTGSGNIPISLKMKMSECQFTSIDISEEAIEVAHRNAISLNVDINFIQLNFLEEWNWNLLGNFNLIVSNPPYIRQSEQLEMSRHVKDFEPSIALFVTDSDPLLFYRKIASFASQFLENGGVVYVEINESLGDATCKVFSEYGFMPELKQDLQGKDRMIKAKLLSE